MVIGVIIHGVASVSTGGMGGIGGIGVRFEKFFIVLYRCFTCDRLIRHKKVLY